jgi:hypothetical protein
MQNDYLNNKKKYSIKNLDEKKSQVQFKINNKTKVDINKLLNRVKIEQKNKKKENLAIIGLVCSAIFVIGIISIF